MCATIQPRALPCDTTPWRYRPAGRLIEIAILEDTPDCHRELTRHRIIEQPRFIWKRLQVPEEAPSGHMIARGSPALTAVSRSRQASQSTLTLIMRAQGHIEPGKWDRNMGEASLCESSSSSCAITPWLMNDAAAMIHERFQGNLAGQLSADQGVSFRARRGRDTSGSDSPRHRESILRGRYRCLSPRRTAPPR